MVDASFDNELSGSSDSSGEGRDNGPPVTIVSLTIIHVGESSGTRLVFYGSLFFREICIDLCLEC